SLLPIWNRPLWYTTVGTLRLDSSNFDFSQVDSTGREVDVARTDSTPIPFDIVEWDKPGRMGRILVRLEPSLLAPGSRFLLRWKRRPETRTDPLAVWREIPEIQRLRLGSVLVDDFEKPSHRSHLPDSVTWYTVASDSTVTVSSPSFVAGGGNRGTVVRITYKVPSGSGKWALIGIVPGHNAVPCRMRTMDSLVFWAKGSGKVSLAFDRLPPYAKGKAWTHRMLDTVWTRYSIRPQDLEPPEPNTDMVGWEAVRDQVTNLTFLVSGGTDLYLDDIRIHGIDVDDLR
ncbi:MAG TPA: hypothetical protein PKY05_15755, partial [Fibrobacteria bacterium]|nr:hypothetical protein [Fibrobacteria bacterium]